MKGPAIFLAQYAGDAPPFDSLGAIARWAADLGFKGVQIPTWDRRLFDLARAAESDAYCDEVKGVLAEAGLEVSELSTHTQGQMVAVHPAYDALFDAQAPARVRGNPAARQAWAVEQVLMGAKASRRMGLAAHVTFSGSLAWPYLYPYPQRPAGLVEQARSVLHEVDPEQIRENLWLKRRIADEMGKVKTVLDETITDLPRRKLRLAV